MPTMYAQAHVDQNRLQYIDARACKCLSLKLPHNETNVAGTVICAKGARARLSLWSGSGAASLCSHQAWRGKGKAMRIS